MSGASFYARPQWRDLWNVRRPNGARHRGLDIAASARRLIPILSTGVVVLRGDSAELGRYLVLAVGAEYHGYCHLYGTLAGLPAIGRTLYSNNPYFAAAGPLDDPGTSWTGPHLHLTRGLNATHVYQGTTLNPAPVVVERLAAFAGSGTIPLPIPTPRRKKQMQAIIGRLNGGTLAIFGDNGWDEFRTADEYNLNRIIILSLNAKRSAEDQLWVPPEQVATNFVYFEDNAWLFMKRMYSGDATITVPPLTSADIAAIAAAVDAQLDDEQAQVLAAIAAVPGGTSTDIQPILDALSLLPAATIDELKARL
jgi:hypothetical protein